MTLKITRTITIPFIGRFLHLPRSISPLYSSSSIKRLSTMPRMVRAIDAAFGSSSIDTIRSSYGRTSSLKYRANAHSTIFPSLISFCSKRMSYYRSSSTSQSFSESFDCCEEDRDTDSEENVPYITREMRWSNMVGKIIKFRKEHGHSNIPTDYDGDPSLGAWVDRQRQHYKLYMLNKPRSTMTVDRIKTLDSDDVKFVWDAHCQRWEHMFGKLVEYKNAEGTCTVAAGREKILGLWNWCNTQRALYNRMKRGESVREAVEEDGNSETERLLDGDADRIVDKDIDEEESISSTSSTLTVDRIRSLEKIGFVWSVRDAYWWEMLGELKDFRRNSGHCIVPIRDTDEPLRRNLAKWVDQQRQIYVKGSMSEERYQLLFNEGFIWNVPEYKWNQRYEELKEYVEMESVKTSLFYKYPITTQKSSKLWSRMSKGDDGIRDADDKETIRPRRSSPLGRWILNQEKEFTKYKTGRGGTMTNQRLEQLRDLGYCI